MNPDYRDIPAAVSSEEADRVFQVALSLIPAAEAFGRKFQLGSDTAHDVMMEAAKRVVESRRSTGDKAGIGDIKNLPAYLFTVARNLMVAELRRRKEEVSIEDHQNSLASRGIIQSDDFRFVENRILLAEIVKRMNPKARTIFTYRTYGYDYDEIADKFKGMGYPTTPGTLRSELSKAIHRITKELEKAGYYR